MEDLKATCATISEAEMSEAGAKSIQEVISTLEHMTEQDPEGLEAALMECKANGRLDDFYNAVGMVGSGASPSIRRGVEVMPTPGFVLKTQKLSDGTKVFVNICSSALLPIPALKKRLDKEGNEIEGISMPLSIGPPREVVDKSGKPCIAYDAVCSPIVLEEANTDKTGAQRDELCQLILNRIEVKYAEALNPQYKLPRASYIGTVVPQRVRDTSKDPIIEEIAAAPVKGSGGPDDPGIQNTNSDLPRECSSQPLPSIDTPPPPSICCKISYKLNGIWKYRRQDITSLSLDDTAEHSRQDWPSSMELGLVGLSPQDCTFENMDKFQVNVSPFEACIDIAGYSVVSVLFPYVTLPETAVCEMYPHDQLLVLRVHVDMSPLDAGPDPGSRPWRLSQALSGRSVGKAPRQAADNSSKQPRQLEKKSICDDGSDDSFHGHGLNLGRRGGEDLGLENQKLPEDKFHKTDALSQYILQQRDEQQNNKSTDEYSGEDCMKQKRDVSPGIEYLDVDRFKEEEQQPIDAEMENNLLLSSEKVSRKLNKVVGKHSLENKLWTTVL